PFDGDGALDLPAFRANVRAHLAAGLHGIVVAGSTGEAALLDEAERAQLVEAARAETPAGRPLIVGIGAESTRATVARARMAAERGADAVLVVAPHYYGDAMTTDALRTHYERVADASPAPVLLYTIPKYMHFALSPALVAELARHENIVGMKDSSGDAALFRGYLESRCDAFQVLTGSGTLLGEALRLGADGAILAVALFAPMQSLLVLAAVRDGDADALAGAQAHLSPLAAEIVGGMGVAGVKAALDAVGLGGGAPRAPLQQLDEQRLAQMQELLRAADLLAP
ncbi:MAG: dihydrodipicolinate synthetase, partial [Gemmatimonadetes bacterium]|nr:dihydrodipicolinate synthetase [Gemmatimonadota bacterium]